MDLWPRCGTLARTGPYKLVSAEAGVRYVFEKNANDWDATRGHYDGVEAMGRIHHDRPELPVVILAAHADPGVEKEAREAGASGFLAKGTALEDIILVLNEATEGVA